MENVTTVSEEERKILLLKMCALNDPLAVFLSVSRHELFVLPPSACSQIDRQKNRVVTSTLGVPLRVNGQPA